MAHVSQERAFCNGGFFSDPFGPVKRLDRLLEFLRSDLQGMLLFEEVDIGPDFILKYFPVQGFVKIIDSACLISPEDLFGLSEGSGDEDDRNAFRAFATPHQFSSFKPIHHRHVHIQQNQGDVMLQHERQRFVTRNGFDDVQFIAPDDGFQGDQVLYTIINNQNVEFFL